MPVGDDVLNALEERLSADSIIAMARLVIGEFQIRFNQNQIAFLKKMKHDELISERSWENATKAIVASMDKKVRQFPPSFTCGPGVVSSKFQRSPETVIIDIANYLDPRSILLLATTCKHGHTFALSAEVWKWRPLDLSHVSTTSEWNEAMQRGCKSVHWKCATKITAPTAKSIRVSHEFLCFFGGRVKFLDLTAVYYVALADYVFFLNRMREVYGHQPENILLPAAKVSEAKISRRTRQTIARYLMRLDRNYSEWLEICPTTQFQ
jgi:hypothetical protein